MDEKELILEDCPMCRGNGMIVHEGGILTPRVRKAILW